ncbi:MAG: UvrD-helicase domain-containing protein, partial [Clostridia bacterium]|nr:UvrD-helicase domain-containing protein [Clostridia bacterium]
MPQLNPQQQMAVQLRGCNILVSAAAGSGKTFVLTQRVAQRLMDPEDPIDADRFLISTFTRSAAAQMKSKIRSCLEEYAAADARLAARQRVLLELAQIGTIDSFCLTLVREYGAAVGVPPTVAVSDETLVRQHEAAAVRDVLSRYYAEASPAFERLAELYFSGATRDPLTDDILDCLDRCQIMPDPKGWLKTAVGRFDDAPEAHEFWNDRALQYAKKQLSHCMGKLSAMRATAQAAQNGAWCNRIAGYEEQLTGLCQAAEQGIEQLKEQLNGLKLANAPEKKTPEDAFLSAVKGDISADIKELNGLLFVEETERQYQRSELSQLCAVFARIVSDCLDEAAQRKRAAGVYGFSDISRAAYELLVQHDENGTAHRTPLAEQLSRDYDEIMIDEFQDVNELQFGIFEALSNGRNLYMVGDVKQSIYRFRGSRPEIFDRVAREYAADPTRGRLLQLNYNYRSHPGVLSAANFIFTLMMHEQTAEIEYDELARLNCGRPQLYEGVEDGGFDFELISRGEMSAAETEARFIAARIKGLLTQQIRVGDESRSVRLGDICIMARKNSVLTDLHAQLTQMGIPCSFVKSGNLFETPEVAALLALLRAVNHPSDDVAMLAALMSPVWGFDPDDMAVLSKGRRELSVYARLLAARENTDYPAVAQKCVRVAEELTCLQNCSVMMSVPELIDAALTVTDFAANAAAFGDGSGQSAARCRENLATFSEYAAGIGSGSAGALSEFLQAVDLAISRDKYPLSKPSQDVDSVSLMTVHGSK